MRSIFFFVSRRSKRWQVGRHLSLLPPQPPSLADFYLLIVTATSTAFVVFLFTTIVHLFVLCRNQNEFRYFFFSTGSTWSPTSASTAAGAGQSARWKLLALDGHTWRATATPDYLAEQLVSEQGRARWRPCRFRTTAVFGGGQPRASWWKFLVPFAPLFRSHQAYTCSNQVARSRLVVFGFDKQANKHVLFCFL